MEDKAVHIRRREARILQHLADAAGHRLHGEAEHRLPLHVDVGGGAGVDAGGVEDLVVAPAAQHRVDGGVILPPLHHGRGGSVPKEDAGAPVGVVGDPAEDLGPQDKAHLPRRGGEQALGGVEGVDKSGAGGVQVEADGVLLKAQLPLQDAGRGGIQMVPGEGGHQAHPHVRRVDVPLLQGLPGRGQAQLGVGLPLSADMPGVDAGAGGDPLVAGVHHFGQIFVGEDPLGHGRAGAHKFQSAHVRSFLTPFRPMARNFL